MLAFIEVGHESSYFQEIALLSLNAEEWTRKAEEVYDIVHNRSRCEVTKYV